MLVLLVEPNPAAAPSTVSMLERAGHRVDVCSDSRHAVQRARARGHAAVVLDWLTPHIDGIELTRELKHESAVRCVAMLSDLPQKEAREHALRAGVDVYLLKPCPLPTLVSALRRFDSGTSPKLAAMSTDETRLLRCESWVDLSTRLEQDLGEFSGVSFEAHEGEPTEPRAFEVVASLAMLEVSAQLEIQVSVAASKASGATLIEQMLRFKNADAEMIAETFTELCNTILGRLKRELAELGNAFTLQVGNVPRRATSLCLGEVLSTRSAVLEAAGIQLAVEAVVRRIGTQTLSIGDLTENMILAEDLKNAAGTMLLSKGTRITASTAARVKAQLGAREVRIAKAGA